MMAPTDQNNSAFYVVEAHHIQRCQNLPHQTTFVQDIQGIHPHSVTFPILPSNATVADTLFNGYTTSSCAVKKARKENHHYLKFTDSQVNVLEQFFVKNRKPGRVDKEDLAQQLGVQISRINHWFQNRKQKERADKQRLEAAFSQKLERAGARRKHMRKGSNSMPIVMSASDINMLVPVQSGQAHAGIQLSPSGASLPPNPSINCASRSEACCESLKRTLAAGKAAAEAAGYGNTLANENEPEVQKQPHSAHDCEPPNFSLNPFDSNFYPVSAFSDWGSTGSSMPSYTPTPAGQGEDPFEFDSPSMRGSPAYTEFQDVSADCSARCSATFPQNMLPVCYQDQYAYFVAMAEINASRASESIALRQPPPSRRPSKTEEEDKEVTPTPEDKDVKMVDTGSRRPSLTRSMTCPDMMVVLDAAESEDGIRSKSDDDEMSTVTSEALTKVPAKLPRSYSFNNGQMPLLPTGGSVKKNKASSIRNRIQKVKDGKNIPRSPLHVEQFSNGGYFDHTAESSIRAESDVCSNFSLEAELSMSGRLTPPTPISPSEQYSISKAEPRIVELDKDMSPHEPRPQRVNNCRRIFELTTPMVESECGDQIDSQFDPSDINFFGLNVLSSGFEFQDSLDTSYPNVLAFDIPAEYDAPPAPPLAYGNHY